MALDWQTVAFVFPGQGSQVVGMGADFYQQYATARDVFSQADDILNMPISRMMFEGPEESLNDTSNTQPAIYVCSIAILRVLQELIPKAQPAAVAGHSLGELTALTAAEALSFDDGLKLVQKRGFLMKQAGEQHPGAMAAILGLDAVTVRDICSTASEQSGQPVVLANDNCPGQIVISGDSAALKQAVKAAESVGARRVIELAVSVATHSPLMHPAEAGFKLAVETTPFEIPRMPVYANLSALPLTSIAGIYAELEGQLTGAVLWTDLIQNMVLSGIRTFVEIGPGDVLTGLIKRIDRSVERVNIGTVSALETFSSAQ